ncbi:MAG: hypothetical protein NTW50_04200 [Candidatus Berkelbacteria bacterium]|nr:hypothetical protein [Candidatus Berkelbacteria bacterium]
MRKLLMLITLMSMAIVAMAADNSVTVVYNNGNQLDPSGTVIVNYGKWDLRCSKFPERSVIGPTEWRIGYKEKVATWGDAEFTAEAFAGYEKYNCDGHKLYPGIELGVSKPIGSGEFYADIAYDFGGMYSWKSTDLGLEWKVMKNKKVIVGAGGKFEEVRGGPAILNGGPLLGYQITDKLSIRGVYYCAGPAPYRNTFEVGLHYDF